MLRNYIKTAFRSLNRHKFFSFINIFGLAIAMSICLGIIMLVADQMTYDIHNTKRDRIYRITSIPVGADGLSSSGNEYSTSPMPLRQELIDNYTGIEKIVQIKRGFGNGWIEFDQNVNVPLSGFFVDPEMLDIFEYELEYGDANTALTEPYTVVLTKRASKKLFKEENPIGKTIKVGDIGTYTVTGILRETDRKSHIVFEGLASMASWRSQVAMKGKKKRDGEDWHNHWDTWNYLLLEKGKTADDIKPHLAKIYKTKIATVTNPDIQKTSFSLQSLREITPGKLLNNPIGPFLPWIFIYFFAGLAGVVMLTSCFNFTNLSIARSLTRAREIGVRKVSGAARWQIFTQFLSESVITALLALALSFVFLMAIKPLMLNLTFARVLKWDLESNIYVYGVFVVFAVVIGILAGLFPAVVLSGFQPVKVLKNLGSMKLFSKMGLRKALLVSQFTLSLIFILTVIVIYNQLNLFVRADHGFDMKNNVVVRLNNTSSQNLKTELAKHSNITNVATSSHVPAASTTYGSGFKKSLDEKEWTDLEYYSVDEDYLKNLSLTMIAGRNFSAEAGISNKNFILINEQSVRAFHFASPADAIGQTVIHDHDSSKLEIIGVVKDYNHQMMMQKISPMALMYNPDQFQILQVKYSGDYSAATKSIEESWAKVNPSLKLDYKNFEEEILSFYHTIFGDLVNIVMMIAFLAIMISCLGLLGMATYTTETRMKEISIRKILGSSDASLIVLLSKGFVKILLVAILIAVPSAYFLNNLWLEQVAYHTSFDFVVVITGVMMLVVFGAVTIGSQTIRATKVNPVENLKSE
ncbi:MAG: FtsX-like permease family protein [Cyclobacteriaceae bacterium]|nr:FtsX-like permease family protein [Cyclobacteriaceae bacterium]